MIILKTTLIALSLALGACAFAADPVSVPNRAAVEVIVHDYILAHPEIIPEALQALEDRKQAKAIDENRRAIETPFGAEWEGNPKGDVTLVEFFDYNCGYCRASEADVKRLLTEDKMLRVVYREIPVLGAESDAAAIVSLAIAHQGGNWPAFHRAVFASEGADAASLIKAQRASGVMTPSAAALKAPALRDEINANLNLAQPLRISGTPSWVVGDRLLSGAVGYEALKAAISAARTKAAH